VKAIAYRNEPCDRSLAGFLNNDELLDRVFANKPYMGMSIKVLHGLVQRDEIRYFQTGYVEYNTKDPCGQRITLINFAAYVQNHPESMARLLLADDIYHPGMLFLSRIEFLLP
jgi:hypothetical protein